MFKFAQAESVVRWTDRPDMNIAVDCDLKRQTKPISTQLKIKFKLLISATMLKNNAGILTFMSMIYFLLSSAWKIFTTPGPVLFGKAYFKIIKTVFTD